jgi:hypothetical protein
MGLVSLVAVLAIGAFALKPGGGGSSGGSELSAQVDQARFTAADASLAAYRASTGTFVGAPAPEGMRLVRVDAASYCLQSAGSGGAVEHELGPGGGVEAGPCS